MHYSGSAAVEFKDDLNRRLEQFQDYSRVECLLELSPEVHANGASYIGYSYAEMLGEDGSIDIWVMVLGDEIPVVSGIQSSGGGNWKISEVESASVGEDASVFLIQSGVTESLSASGSSLAMTISSPNGREMSWSF